MFHHNLLIMSCLVDISLKILLTKHFHYLIFALYFLILSSFLQNFVIYSSSLHLTFLTCASSERSFIVNPLLYFLVKSVVLLTLLYTLFTIVSPRNIVLVGLRLFKFSILLVKLFLCFTMR